MRKGLALAALDLMGSLLLVVFVLVAPPVVETTTASIETHGKWVVVTTWAASDNDVDTWYQAPNGSKVWWQNPRSANVHLEQDDRGIHEDDPTAANRERVVLRTIEPGEHIVTLHCYACYDTPIVVRVELWRLEGDDEKVYSVRLTLRSNRVEQTAFRFRLDEAGALQDLNRLPARLVNL